MSAGSKKNILLLNQYEVINKIKKIIVMFLLKKLLKYVSIIT